MKVGEQIQIYVRTFPGGEWLFEFEPLQARVENLQPLICTITEEPDEESEAEFLPGSRVYVLKDERLGYVGVFGAN